MIKPARTTVPLIVSTALGLSAVTMMFALPTSAEPLPTTYSAQAAGDVWHLNQLDLDLSGDPADIDLSVTRAEGVVSSTATTRSTARSENIAGATATGQAVRRGAISSATKTSDNSAPVAGTAPAGTVTDLVDLEGATLSSLGRWTGDTSCVPATERLSDSRALSEGSSLVATDIPAEDPSVTIPIVDLEIPLPGDIPLPLPDPTDPPEDIPGLPTTPPTVTDTPTLITDTPTLVTDIPTISTDLPSTILPTLPTLPTLLRAAAPPAATTDVVMASVAPAAVEEHTWLGQRTTDPDVRVVRAEAIGTALDLNKAVVSFFDGEIAVRMASQPRLTASADGVGPGVVTWSPPALTLLVAGQANPLNVPADGTPVTVNYSANRQVVVEVSAGKVTDKVEHATGLVASARAAVMHVTITRATTTGETVVLDADLFPMRVEAKSPTGGVECRVESPEVVSPEVKLKGRDNGAKADRLKVLAVTDAAGARATLFKVVNGKRTKLKSGTLDGLGERKFKVKDKNGKQATKYVVKVRKTTLTTAGKASKKVR